MELTSSAAILGLIVFGTFTSLAAKIVYQLEGIGIDGHLKHFEKPWAMTTVMFIGMTFCLPLAIYNDRRAREKSQQQAGDEDGAAATEPLLPSASSTTAKHNSNSWKEVFMLAIPTFFDLVATVLMNVGLLSVTASVYQMLRGAEMLFAAFLAVVFLKRKLNKYHFAGIACCISGIALVGASSIAASSSESGGGAAPAPEGFVLQEGTASSSASSPGRILTGMALIVASQAVQAAQITFEDYFMADLAIPPLKIVGYEGIFGATAMLFVLLPIVQHLPGKEGAGIHEDSHDTWHMISNTPSIAIVLVLDAMALMAYNVAGMCVTGHLGAVFRTVLETTRTLFVWLVDLMLFYTPLGFGRLGESWTKHSWLQAAGFVILVAGTVIYGRGDETEVAEAIAEGRLDDGEGDEEGDDVERRRLLAGADENGSTQPLSMRSAPRTMPSNIATASSLKSSVNINAFGSMPLSVPRSLRNRMMSPPGRQ